MKANILLVLLEYCRYNIESSHRYSNHLPRVCLDYLANMNDGWN